MVFTLKVYQIPEATKGAKGRNIINLVQMPPGEEVKVIIPLPNNFEGKFILFSTRNGTIKRTELSEYGHIKQSGIRGIKILDGDSLVDVRISDGKKDVLIAASSGRSIRFSESDARAMGRVSQGVRGINITEKERVIGMELIQDGDEILSVTENGYGKRTEAAEYRSIGRGGKGVLAMKLTAKTGDIIQMLPVTGKEDLMIITDKGQVIRTNISGISLMSRNTQGVRLINLKEGERVVAVEKVAAEEEPEQISDGTPPVVSSLQDVHAMEMDDVHTREDLEEINEEDSDEIEDINEEDDEDQSSE